MERKCENCKPAYYAVSVQPQVNHSFFQRLKDAYRILKGRHIVIYLSKNKSLLGYKVFALPPSRRNNTSFVNELMRPVREAENNRLQRKNLPGENTKMEEEKLDRAIDIILNVFSNDEILGTGYFHEDEDFITIDHMYDREKLVNGLEKAIKKILKSASKKTVKSASKK